MFNSIVQGWINYYGRFCKSIFYPVLRRLNRHWMRGPAGSANGRTSGAKGHALAGRGGQTSAWPVCAPAVRTACQRLGGSHQQGGSFRFRESLSVRSRPSYALRSVKNSENAQAIFQLGFRLAEE